MEMVAKSHFDSYSHIGSGRDKVRVVSGFKGYEEEWD